MSTKYMTLPDYPCCYRLDPKSWEDWKKSVRDCSIAWNFRDWLNTIVYGSALWQRVAEAGKLKVKTEEDEEVKGEALPASGMSDEVRVALGYNRNEVDFFQSSTRYINVVSCVIENRTIGSSSGRSSGLGMVRCLHGPGGVAGPYHCLRDQVQLYDVAALYRQLARVIETPTIVSQADDLAAVFLFPFNAQTQDVFTYIGEVRRLIRRVHDTNAILPEDSRIQLPDNIFRALMIRAIRHVPLFKPLVDQIIIQDAEEWRKLTPDALYKHMEQGCVQCARIGATTWALVPQKIDVTAKHCCNKQKETTEDREREEERYLF